MPVGEPVEPRIHGTTMSAWRGGRHRANSVVDRIRLAADERDLVALEPEDEDRSRRHELLREHLDRQSMLGLDARAEMADGEEPNEDQAQDNPADGRSAPKPVVSHR